MIKSCRLNKPRQVMTTGELDTYLRKHTFAEEMFLFYKDAPDNATFDITSGDTRYLDDCMRKNFPMLVKDYLVANWTEKKLELDEATIEYSEPHIMLSCQPRFTHIPPHRHSYIEMNYVYSGTCKQVVNGKTVVLQKGDLCVFDTNVVHAIEAGRDEDILINCLLSRDYLQDIILTRLAGGDLISSFFVQSIYRGGGLSEYMIFRPGGSSRIESLMGELLCAFFDPNTCADEILSSYVTLICYELMRIHDAKRSDPTQEERSEDKMPAVLRYIRKHYRRARLSSTAEHFGVHPSYLGMKIKEATGMSFMDILHEERLKRARILLENSDMPICDIVNDVGYENMSFFYRIFKEKHDCTPAEFRSRSRKQMAPQRNGSAPPSRI